MDKNEESYRASPLRDFVPFGDHETPQNTLTVRPKTAISSVSEKNRPLMHAHDRASWIFSFPCISPFFQRSAKFDFFRQSANLNCSKKQMEGREKLVRFQKRQSAIAF
jgi:hypothetical protein